MVFVSINRISSFPNLGLLGGIFYLILKNIL